MNFLLFVSLFPLSIRAFSQGEQQGGQDNDTALLKVLQECVDPELWGCAEYKRMVYRAGVDIDHGLHCLDYDKYSAPWEVANETVVVDKINVTIDMKIVSIFKFDTHAGVCNLRKCNFIVNQALFRCLE